MSPIFDGKTIIEAARDAIEPYTPSHAQQEPCRRAS